MKKNIIFFFIIIAMISCSKNDEKELKLPIKTEKIAAPSEEPTSSNQLKEAISFVENEHKISIKTINGKLYTGYNDIYVTISDKSGKELSPESIVFLPMMRMYETPKVSDKIKFSHSCPHTNNLKKLNDNRFRGFSIFQMHTGDLGRWEVKFSYKIGERSFETAFQKIEILKRPENNHFAYQRFQGKDGKTYILALVSPSEHKNGRNANVLAGLFRAESMMSFPMVKGFEIQVDPRMPGEDMQNHSTPFEPFKEQADGFYKSVINYSMTGYWELNFIIKNEKGEIIAGTEVPKSPKSTEDYNAKSEVHLRIDIAQ